MARTVRVLFVSAVNAARSQLARALRRHTDSGCFEAFSLDTNRAGQMLACQPKASSQGSHGSTGTDFSLVGVAIWVKRRGFDEFKSAVAQDKDYV